jgi:hypothetical protein
MPTTNTSNTRFIIFIDFSSPLEFGSAEKAIAKNPVLLRAITPQRGNIARQANDRNGSTTDPKQCREWVESGRLATMRNMMATRFG